MKKIAVQTFWSSKYNYGQILQGYALQQFLKQNGFNPYIIRFDSLLSKLKEILMIALKGKLISDYRQGKLRHFDNFKNKNIKYSRKRYNSFRALQKNPPEADFYITGSDQVWTYMRNVERRNAYLLRFGGSGVKKMAYAASFGRNKLEDNEVDIYKEALNDFCFVGVREESGVKICTDLGIKSHWVVDPVALLNVVEWKSVMHPITLKKNSLPNIFLYTLTSGVQNSSIYEILDALSGKYNFYYTNSSKLFDKRMNVTPSIEEWLSYINKCDYVISDSFHCTMFCIIFKKNFVTIKRYGGEKMNNRLISLLNRLGLLNRYVDASPKEVEGLFSIPINWESVEQNFQIWRKESMDSFLSALNL